MHIPSGIIVDISNSINSGNSSNYLNATTLVITHCAGSLASFFVMVVIVMETISIVIMEIMVVMMMMMTTMIVTMILIATIQPY